MMAGKKTKPMTYGQDCDVMSFGDDDDLLPEWLGNM